MATLGFAFFLYAVTTVFFFINRSINDFILPSALICSIVVTSLIGTLRHSDNHTGWIVVTLLIVAGSLLLSNLLYDTSYDGIRYHQETVASILAGWNPLNGDSDSGVTLGIWSRHYAKAIEICEAAITAFTGRIETGKGINIILISGAVAGVYAFLRENPAQYFIRSTYKCKSAFSTTVSDGPGEKSENSFGRVKSIVFALVIVGSPVVLSQIFTFYIDFYKYIYLLFLLLGIALICRKDVVARYRGYAILFYSLVLAMATKFNFFFEALHFNQINFH